MSQSDDHQSDDYYAAISEMLIRVLPPTDPLRIGIVELLATAGDVQLWDVADDQESPMQIRVCKGLLC